jgi:hypothetical protein
MATDTDTAECMTVDEFARRHRISRSQAYKEIASGRLSARKIGSRTVITAEDAASWRSSLPRLIPRTPHRPDGLSHAATESAPPRHSAAQESSGPASALRRPDLEAAASRILEPVETKISEDCWPAMEDRIVAVLRAMPAAAADSGQIATTVLQPVKTSVGAADIAAVVRRNDVGDRAATHGVRIASEPSELWLIKDGLHN